MKKLADLVNIRLKHITKDRRQTRLDLTEATLIPAIKELYNSLRSMENFIQLGHSSRKSLETYLNHSNHIFSDKSKFSDGIRFSHEAASKTNKQNEDLLLAMEFALNDSMDCIKALESLVINLESTTISEIITSAQDLSRNSTTFLSKGLKVYSKAPYIIAFFALFSTSILAFRGPREAIFHKIR